MPGNLRKFVETLLGSQHDLSLSTLGPDGCPESVMAGYANRGMCVYVATKVGGHQVRNLASSTKACVTVVSREKDWGDVRGVTLRGDAVVLAADSPEAEGARTLLRLKYPESRRLAREAMYALAFIRFDPVAAAILDHWDGVGFSELVEVGLDK
jgi:nitroimidazol reductase NimA-like FMN-containing flavoprotein (pyridoxamine 5'-phosphate oxidase superfamily)